jgi:hypothetical protein
MKNGYSVPELVIVLGIFTIVYFVAANVISYNFNVNYEQDSYDLKIKYIEEHAALYAQNNEDIFDDESSIYMTVEELSLENAIVSNSEGVVLDPRNEDKTLNDIKVKITKKKDLVEAKVLG